MCEICSKSVNPPSLVREEDKKRIKNVKVIAGEVVRQHKLLVCDIAYKMDKKVKTKWRSETKIWKLKEEDKRNKYKVRRSEHPSWQREYLQNSQANG